MHQSAFSVCVFCGARSGAVPDYEVAARNLGSAIAENGWRLVYGAGDVGIMGAVAEACQSAGGSTLGVIPTHLLDREAPRRAFGDQIITENMHERKKVMFMNSDAICVLPGGAGSLDEFFEVLTWGQLGLHNKPILLLNIQGYWQVLLDLIDHVIDQGFADASLRNFFQVVDSIDDLVAAMKD
ncbi:MAG: TIGR00730 family Rossman fold protein [Boseongicola sp.]|nr:TIGR00730 family Rossman fold protein [Boseongicola sp.]MDD9979202.1 TIGR00730 family Rossman fold protein [Boseongicola sp.]